MPCMDPSGEKRETNLGSTPANQTDFQGLNTDKIKKSPKNPHNLNFGPNQEFSFQELESPLMEWILKDLGVVSINVERKNGWDYITFNLEKPCSYDVGQKIDAILAESERLGLSTEHDQSNFKNGATRFILNLISSVELDSKISYRGKIDEYGNVIAENLTGMSIVSGIFTVKPKGGIIHANNSATVTAKLGFLPLPEIPQPIPEVFANAIRESIACFEAIRKRRT